MIHLDLTTDLAKVDPDKLGRACRYTAPCAIGIMMSEEDRLVLKDNHVNGTVFASREVQKLVSVPEDQLADFNHLQGAFDNDTNNKDRTLSLTRAALADLKEKYA